MTVSKNITFDSLILPKIKEIFDSITVEDICLALFNEGHLLDVEYFCSEYRKNKEMSL